jgi:hypothetical protein
MQSKKKKKETNRFHIVQCLLVDPILLEGYLTVVDHIVHDLGVHGTLQLVVLFSVCVT